MGSPENRRILVVDDTALIHEDFRKVLCGFSADQARLDELEASIFGKAPSSQRSHQSIQVNYELDSAFQGQEALEKVRAAAAEGRPYAMIFMDVRMPPGWDGIETTKRIWQEFPDTEVVICTAYMDYSAEDIVREFGITDKLLFLRKPFDPVAISQSALAVTTKWNLAARVRGHIRELEQTVAQRTTQLLETSKFAALGEMASGVAHEINTPLATIQLTTEQLVDMVSKPDLSPSDIVRAPQMLRKVQETVRKIAAIIKGLRAFSRDAGDDPMREESLERIIQDALCLCSEKCRTNGIELRVDPFPADLKVQCRPTQLSQVLLYLLNNSHDAILGLDEKWIQISVGELNGRLTIHITDSGGGIPEKVRNKLFQPFFTTKDVGAGTGLGLCVSKGIIEAHGGSIHFDLSCRNTRVVIQLPQSKTSETNKA